MKRLTLFRRWFMAVGSLVGVVAVWQLFSALTAPFPGSLEEVYSRVRVGMTRQEAVAVLSTCPSIDSLYSSITTKDGRTSSRGHFDFFADLPRREKSSAAPLRSWTTRGWRRRSFSERLAS